LGLGLGSGSGSGSGSGESLPRQNRVKPGSAKLAESYDDKPYFHESYPSKVGCLSGFSGPGIKKGEAITIEHGP
jgi:hypothetical protein